jgi:rSAM/selenodomain-associated transferase 2
MNLEKLSIIIPVLNEASDLSTTLEIQKIATNIEIIVVDGGSQDNTIDLALATGAKVIQSELGRAFQMNAGAAIATGDILLFLHGDTQLPKNFDALIRETLAEQTTIAGAFELQINGDLPGLRFVEWGANCRSRHFQMPYGDQGIFLRRETFDQIGGFPALPIMEDFELIRKLRQQGKITIVPAAIVTSGRRWQTLGVLKTTLINQAIILAYFLGVSPQRLRQWYRKQR